MPNHVCAKPAAARGSEDRPLTAAEAEIKARITEQMDQGNHAWVIDAVLGKARTPSVWLAFWSSPAASPSRWRPPTNPGCWGGYA